MTAKTMYGYFVKLFPWFEGDVIKYQSNHKDGGIDVFFKSGEIMNFKFTSRKNWELRRTG